MGINEYDIERVLKERQKEMQSALIEQAETLVPAVVESTFDYISRLKKTKYTKSVMDGVTKEIVTEYKKHVNDGGTMCVERVLTPIGGGKIRATTEHLFVPWLDDMTKEQTKELVDFFAEAERVGIYPLDQAKMIEKYFEGTRHRAVVAARTEAQKLRVDARMASYKKTGVKYVQYITAGDERVRPEHAARDGKIYPLDKAPWLGEYQCRCILTDADYAVEELGIPTEKNEEVILTVNEAMPEKLEATELKFPGVMPDGRYIRLINKDDMWKFDRSVYMPTTEAGIKAQGAYTGLEYNQINNVMRGKYTADEYIAAHIRALKKEIAAQTPLPEGKIIYRGIGSRTGKRLEGMDVGDTFSDAAFQSFSVDTYPASNFAGYTVNDNLIILRGITDGKIKALSGTDYEKELIIEPGTEWIITGKTVVESTRARFVIIDVIPTRG